MPIARAEWDALVVALKNVEQLDQACAAAQKLHQEATKQDVAKLLTLLGDDDAFVREAAAWPLSELAGIPLLRDLLVAYQKGLDEGFDNDGFSAALIDLVELNRPESAAELRSLVLDSNAHIRENALWLLKFCTGE
jgi:HEAT repeat protein